MNAPTLFDEMARTTDPATSHRAAAAVAPTQKAAVLEAIRAAGEQGATVAEIQAALAQQGRHIERGPIARRCTSLRREGLITSPGSRPGPEGRDETVHVAGGESL